MEKRNMDLDKSTIQASQLASIDDPALVELQALIEAKRAAMPPIPVPEKIPITKTLDTTLQRLDRAPVVEISEAEREQRHKDRERNERWGALLRARGTRYEKCRLDNFRCATDGHLSAVARLQDYADNIADRLLEGANVILIGPAGTGKDHLMFGLCHAAIGAYRTVEWINGTSLWLKFRSAIGEERDEYSIVRELTRPDVLAISDPIPPRGVLTDYQASMLFDVVDSRYSNQQPTWVTLNCANRAEAEERMGVQVVDRLWHGALGIACNWPSYRRSAP